MSTTCASWPSCSWRSRGDEEVPELVAPAELDVGLDHDGVPSLEERVEQLHHRDRVALGVALREVVALEHLGDGRARREAQHVLDVHRRQPFGVAPDLERLRQQDLVELVDVGRGVLVDLILRQPRARHRTPRRIADLRGVVAEDEHRGVAVLLELAQLAQHDREAEVDVGRGRVDAELHPEWATFRELLLELGLVDEPVVRLVGDEPDLRHGRGTLPGNPAGTAADMRVAGHEESPRRLVALAHPKSDARRDDRRHRGRRAVVGDAESAAGEVGAVVVAGDPERLAQAREAPHTARGPDAPSGDARG